MSGLRRTYDTDFLIIRQVGALDSNNAVIPALRVLTADGIGGTYWAIPSSLGGYPAFNQVIADNTPIIANNPYNTLVLSTTQGIASVVNNNQITLFSKAFTTIDISGGDTLRGYSNNIVTPTIQFVGTQGISIVGDSNTNTIFFGGGMNIVSTTNGLGNYYVSTSGLVSTVIGVNTSMTTNESITSSINGLGSYYISTATLQKYMTSSIGGLGNFYVSTSSLVSSVKGVETMTAINMTSSMNGLGHFYVSTSALVSTVLGLTIASPSDLTSSLSGLGNYYVSTSALVSTVQGISTTSISASNLTSSIGGLGKFYVSTSGLVSTVISLRATSISASNLTSSIGGLGKLYVSTSGLVSTVKGLGNPYTMVSSIGGLGNYYLSTFTSSFNKLYANTISHSDQILISTSVKINNETDLKILYTSTVFLRDRLNEQYTPFGNQGASWWPTASGSLEQYAASAIYSGSIFTTSNSGITWDTINQPTAYSRNWVSLACNSNCSILIGATELAAGCIWIGSNSTGVLSNWTWAVASSSLPVGADWRSVTCDTTGSIIAVANSQGGAYITSNYANTWTILPVADRVMFNKDASILFTTRFESNAYIGSNYGTTRIWRQLSLAALSWNTIAINTTGKYMAVAGGGRPGNSASNTRIQISVDYGLTWNESTSPLTQWQSLSMSGRGRFIVGCEFTEGQQTGKIWASSDFGDTWNNLSQLGDWRSISFLGNTNTFIASSYTNDFLYTIQLYEYANVSVSSGSLLINGLYASTPTPFATGASNVVSFNKTTSQFYYSDTISISTVNAKIGVLSNGTYLTSDRNVKEKISSADLSICYNNVKELPLRHFKYISSYAEGKIDQTQIGFVAQEVSNFFPKSLISIYDNTLSTSVYHMNFDQIFLSHYGATQLLMSTAEGQQKQIAYLYSTLDSLKN